MIFVLRRSSDRLFQFKISAARARFALRPAMNRAISLEKDGYWS
jgi:hypothetical protein